MLPAIAKKLDDSSRSKKLHKESGGDGGKSQKKSKDKKVKKHKRRKEYSSSSSADDSVESEKKHKRNKKHKKRKEYSSSSDDSDSADESEQKNKRNKKHKKRRQSSDDNSDEWVEKSTEKSTEKQASTSGDVATSAVKRDDWMSGMLIPTFSKEKKVEKEKKSIDSYDPSKFALELNPYWKNGGTGLPTFQKPREDDDNSDRQTHKRDQRSSSSKNWRKKKEPDERDERRKHSSDEKHSLDEKYSAKPTDAPSRSRSFSEADDADGFLPPSRSPSPLIEGDKNVEVKATKNKDFLTDQQMNELGAKIIKAEIMGDDDLIESLKMKLERARDYRKNFAATVRKPKQPDSAGAARRESEDILLTTTNAQGQSRPLQRQSAKPVEDPWGGRGKKRSKKVETHNSGGERVRYFADDDKYDIKQMVSGSKAKQKGIFFIPYSFFFFYSLKMKSFLRAVNKTNNSLTWLAPKKAKTMIWRTYFRSKRPNRIGPPINTMTEQNNKPFDNTNKWSPHWNRAHVALIHQKWKNNCWWQWAITFICHCHGMRL